MTGIKPARRQRPLAEPVADVARGNLPLGRSTAPAEYLDRWIDHMTPTRSPTTIRGYKFKITRITERLGKVPLDRLTAQHRSRTRGRHVPVGEEPTSERGNGRRPAGGQGQARGVQPAEDGGWSARKR